MLMCYFGIVLCSGSSKKKKKKTKSSTAKKAEAAEEAVVVLDEKNMDGFLKGEGEYPYSFLLNRALDMVRSRKPTARKSNIPAPIVLREGTKKTVIENFKDIAKHLNRGLDHLSRFIAVELRYSTHILIAFYFCSCLLWLECAPQTGLTLVLYACE
jgi:translation initiation factor 2 subunit 2